MLEGVGTKTAPDTPIATTDPIEQWSRAAVSHKWYYSKGAFQRHMTDCSGLEREAEQSAPQYIEQQISEAPSNAVLLERVLSLPSRYGEFVFSLMYSLVGNNSEIAREIKDQSYLTAHLLHRLSDPDCISAYENPAPAEDIFNMPHIDDARWSASLLRFMHKIERDYHQLFARYIPAVCVPENLFRMSGRNSGMDEPDAWRYAQNKRSYINYFQGTDVHDPAAMCLMARYAYTDSGNKISLDLPKSAPTAQALCARSLAPKALTTRALHFVSISRASLAAYEVADSIALDLGVRNQLWGLAHGLFASSKGFDSLPPSVGPDRRHGVIETVVEMFTERRFKELSDFIVKVSAIYPEAYNQKMLRDLGIPRDLRGNFANSERYLASYLGICETRPRLPGPRVEVAIERELEYFRAAVQRKAEDMPTEVYGALMDLTKMDPRKVAAGKGEQPEAEFEAFCRARVEAVFSDGRDTFEILGVGVLSNEDEYANPLSSKPLVHIKHTKVSEEGASRTNERYLSPRRVFQYVKEGKWTETPESIQRAANGEQVTLAPLTVLHRRHNPLPTSEKIVSLLETGNCEYQDGKHFYRIMEIGKVRGQYIERSRLLVLMRPLDEPTAQWVEMKLSLQEAWNLIARKEWLRASGEQIAQHFRQHSTTQQQAGKQMNKPTELGTAYVDKRFLYRIGSVRDVDGEQVVSFYKVSKVTPNSSARSGSLPLERVLSNIDQGHWTPHVED